MDISQNSKLNNSDFEQDKRYYMERIAELQSFAERHRKETEQYIEINDSKNILIDQAAYNLTNSLLSEYDLLVSELNARISALTENVVNYAQEVREAFRVFRAASNLKPAIGRVLSWYCSSYHQSLESFAYPLQMQGGLGQRINYDRTNGIQRDIIKKCWRDVLSIPESDAGCILTSSAMSSVGMIEKYLFKHHLKPGASIYIPRTLYSESDLTFFKSSSLWTPIQDDIHDTDAITQRILELSPDVVFLEPMQNSYGTKIVDVQKLLNSLSQSRIERPIHIILDDTLLTGACNPYRFVHNDKISLYVVISALKYLQCGLDISTAGITFCPTDKEEPMQDLCNYAGHGITEHSVYPFPLMTREQFMRRQERLTRNALELVKEVSKCRSDIEVCHPSVANEFTPDWLRTTGCIVTVDLTYLEEARKRQNFGPYFSFIEHLIEVAHKARVSLVCSESFGFDTTRVSVNWCRPTMPFVRFSVGTEDLKEIQKAAVVVREAIDSFAEKQKPLA